MTYAETSLHVHYVTAVDTPERVALLAGPFRTRQDAEARVEDVRMAIRALRPDLNSAYLTLQFAGIGTTRALLKPGATAPRGALNAQLGIAS